MDPLDSTIASVRLRVPHQGLAELHPADLASIIDQLAPRDRAGVLASLDDEAVADAIEEMEPETQVEVLEDLAPGARGRHPRGDEPGRRRRPRRRPGPGHRDEILALMEKDEADEVQELLGYPEDSAGGIMTTEFIAARGPPDGGRAIDRLRELEPDAETIYYVYVTDDDGRLVGVLSLRDLIVAQPETPIGDVMIREPVAVGVSADQDEVAEVVAHYNLLAVPGGRRRRAPGGHRHRRRRHRHRDPDRLEEASAARLQPVAGTMDGMSRTERRRPPGRRGRSHRPHADATAGGARPRPSRACPHWRVRMVAVLGVLGPGLVSGFADNDAGGITTYSLAGARFGYSLLWVILASQVVLFFTQEVGARLGSRPARA